MSSFLFSTESSEIWLTSGLVRSGAGVLLDGFPRHSVGDSLGALLIASYGRETSNGSVCSVRWLWSGQVIGRAGGGGYDRRGTALADALTYLYGVPSFDGGRGEAAVVDHAARFGVEVAHAAGLAFARANDLGVLS
jgi:hypothetical protein